MDLRGEGGWGERVGRRVEKDEDKGGESKGVRKRE
jgi:hypothetical protein